MVDVLTPLKAAAAITTNTAPTPGQITRYNASAGALAVTLPALSGLANGAIYPVQKDTLDTSANTVTFTCAGADTFDDAATTLTLRLSGSVRTLAVVTIGATKYWKSLPSGHDPLTSLDNRFILRPGNLTVFLGDSETAGADDVALFAARGSSWPVYASIMSGQRLQYVRNAGIGGNTTANMLARFDTDVTPYAPRTVTLMAGTNDVLATAFATWQATYMAIVAKIRAIGAVPILCTMPPNNATTGGRKQLTVQFNGFIRRYAALNGLLLLDFYTVLTDPATSDYKAAYYNDGTHPNEAGFAAMGAYAAALLANQLPPPTVQLCADDNDPNNVIVKGCFTAGSGSSLPTGWADLAGTPAGSVLSYTTDAAVPGQMLTLTHTAAAGVRQLGQTVYVGSTTLTNATSVGATSLVIPVRADYGGVLFIGSGATFEVAKILSSSGGGPQTETLVRPLLYAHAAGETVICNGVPGDEMIFSGVVTSNGGVPVSVTTSCVGAAYSPAPVSVLAAAITRGVFHQRFLIPAATTQIAVRFQANAGTGVASFGQCGFYNATRLGM